MPTKIITAILLLTLSAPVFAETSEEKLSTCITNTTTGKERKDLARWIFTVMAVHPELSGMSTISAEKRDEISKLTANTFTSIMTDRCVIELKQVMANEGPEGAKRAFESLGRLAMTELMNNQAVTNEVGYYVKFADTEKLGRALYAK
jgi:hypothetical protein